MEINLEPLTDELIKEHEALFVLHYDEVARKDLFPLPDPAWDFYKMADKNGFLRLATLRDNGKLIGYWWWIVKNNPHYKNVRVAVDDVLYVVKEHRGDTAFNFMNLVLGMIKAEVHVVQTHCKSYFDLTNIYTKLGFEPFEKGFIQKGNL